MIFFQTHVFFILTNLLSKEILLCLKRDQLCVACGQDGVETQSHVITSTQCGV